MHVSLEPIDPAPRREAARIWLLRILATSRLEGHEVPRSLKGTIYIDNVPHSIHPGAWQVDGATVYCGGISTYMDQMARISILATIANLTGAIDDPAVVEALSNKLITSIKDSVMSVYASFIKATSRPSRLAINLENTQIAAELRGNWFLTSGAPAEVTPSWIVMDF